MRRGLSARMRKGVSGRPTGITFLVRQGQRLLAESEGGDPEDAEKRAAQIRLSFEPADIVNEVMSFGAPTPVEVTVYGPNQDDNRAYAAKVKAEMAKIPALRDLQFAQAQDYPTVEVQVDRERAGQSGVTVQDVSRSLVSATSSSLSLIHISEPTRPY